MRTRYKIDTYQQSYFVIDSFEQLFGLTAPDFSPLYERVKGLSDLAANASLPEDQTVSLKITPAGLITPA
jgi:phenylalanine-4-hydroxylase